MAAHGSKPVPTPTPDSAPFWEGAAAGELRLPRCVPCDAFFYYPRSACPTCSSTELSWETVSGRGKLHTYLINHRPAPGFADEAPYAIAVVELEEGPRMMSNIVGIENTPENLVLDMDLVVIFDTVDGVAIPRFTPAGAQA